MAASCTLCVYTMRAASASIMLQQAMHLQGSVKTQTLKASHTSLPGDSVTHYRINAYDQHLSVLCFGFHERVFYTRYSFAHILVVVPPGAGHAS